MTTFDITGKNALVTGANRGIGKAIAETLLANGVAKVYAAVRDLSSAEPLVATYGGRVVPVAFDLGQPELFQAAAERADDVHIVVNNAGVLRIADTLAEDAIEALQFEIDRNVYGLIRTARAFAPVLAKNGGGALVQLNTVASIKAFPDMATYCASKAASYSITQSLRAQLAPQGTAVYSIHPGPIATQMGDDAGFAEIAEPPTRVAEALLEAFETGSFHIFPDTMAKMIGEAYQSYAENIVEADLSEGAS